MATKYDSVKVIAPATVANVGVGFDSCAFAVSMYNEYVFTRVRDGISISGCPEEYRNERNMAYVTYKAVFDEAGEDVGGVAIDIKSGIHISRGLGSSAAMLVGGAEAANAMLGEPFDKMKVLDICMRIEPHPDNICACVYGGFTSAVQMGDDTKVYRSDIDDSLRFYALIPDFAVSTDKARAMMPEKIPMADAVHNISRAALLPRAFAEGDREIIAVATDDRLHEQYRRGLIEGFDEVRDAAKECGAYAYFISGAGPTCMAMSDNDGFAAEMRERLEASGHEREIIGLAIERNGTRVVMI